MSNIPEDLKYTETHEWVKIEGDLIKIGITDHAQNELTDIVFVELPETGSDAVAAEAFIVVESVKMAADIYSPVNGLVTEVNNSLEDDPGLINSDPYGEGWIVSIKGKISDENKLLTADQYKELVG